MAEGFVLMVVGMMTVFAFLVFLVAAMQASTAFFRKYAHLFPEAPESTGPKQKKDPLALVAAAIAAVHVKNR